ncbi:hypothetical protein ABENE_19450 [Asticcacaulis benevestitus DSM 16100 = ATCC BAA-896]|uniref:Uncharacterized protein n=1 Tax=Asticcacaulis benevestitus DSM 16100 = ATCC BAA-896 TaxID=1121022 RepID=V4PCY2_9CAUL|nr:hypothetical protein ABENE_19450 [Asticcacaulis benevestitus DSM 16100 = ATCC BAA-896]
MAIISSAFGGVTLTGSDARKFQDQVTYGRPKSAAIESVKRGVEMAKEYKHTGYVQLKTKPKK